MSNPSNVIFNPILEEFGRNLIIELSTVVVDVGTLIANGTTRGQIDVEGVIHGTLRLFAIGAGGDSIIIFTNKAPTTLTRFQDTRQEEIFHSPNGAPIIDEIHWAVDPLNPGIDPSATLQLITHKYIEYQPGDTISRGPENFGADMRYNTSGRPII